MTKKQELRLEQTGGSMFEVHSPREIFGTMYKTGQDALQKRKP